MLLRRNRNLSPARWQLLGAAGVGPGVGRWIVLFWLGFLSVHGQAETEVATSTPAPVPAVVAPTAEATPADIQWEPTRETLAAKVPKQRLSQVLPRLARATGWQIFIEPGTDPLVNSAFRPLPVTEALEQLLNGQNFALRTGKNGRSRLLIYRTSDTGATEEVAPDYVVVERVANELLVQLKPDAKHTIEEIAAKLGAKVVGKLAGMDIYRLRFPDEESTNKARASLAKDPDIAASGDNLLLHGPNPGELKALGAGGGGGLSLKPANIDRSKLIIGLIDTVVRPLGPQFDSFVMTPQSVVGAAPDGNDLTHGTAMLANILHGAQVTLGAGQEAAFRVLPVNVYAASEDKGRANLFDVLNGTQLAIQQGASIINWSLSSPDQSPLVTQFTRYYQPQGVTFLAAAGNQPVTDNMYPAADPGVIAITALGRDGNYASYANRGSFVDVGLPGSDLVNFGDTRYLINGTSTATAFGSGILAARSQMTGAAPPTLLPWLINAFPPPGKK